MNKKLKIHDGDTSGKVLEVKLEYPKQKGAIMSNVWHTPIFIPDPFRAHPIIIIYEAGDEIEQMMSNEYRARVGDRYVNRWCYIDDLLNCEKALEIAIDWLKQVATPEQCNDELCREFTKHKLSKITALIKGDGNE